MHICIAKNILELRENVCLVLFDAKRKCYKVFLESMLFVIGKSVSVFHAFIFYQGLWNITLITDQLGPVSRRHSQLDQRL